MAIAVGQRTGIRARDVTRSMARPACSRTFSGESASSRSRGIAPVGSATVWRSSSYRAPRRTALTGPRREIGSLSGRRSNGRSSRITRRPSASMASASRCQRPQAFTVGFDYAVRDEQGTRVPNWREHLVCECGLNARTRAAIHVLTMKLRVPRNARIYLMEQQSLLYDWLKQRYPNLVGSEYVGDKTALGASWRGIRNEDATRLTFSDRSFDCVLSFDVLEHVPDYRRAFKEVHRCLADGGTFLFTAPFVRNSETTIERARVSDSGEIEHLLEPEYHGDPLNPEGGILCFQHFGWDIIDMLKSDGFADARGHFLWSRRLGYLGGEQALFTATR